MEEGKLDPLKSIYVYNFSEDGSGQIGDLSTKGDSNQETEYDKLAGVLSCLVIFFLRILIFWSQGAQKVELCNGMTVSLHT